MPKSPVRKRTPEQIIAGARRPERTVTVCLRADISDALVSANAELTELTAERVALNDMIRTRNAQAREEAKADKRVGGNTPEDEPEIPYSDAEIECAERIHDLEVEAEENSLDFTIRAIPRHEWRAIKDRHPANEKDAADGWAIDVDLACTEAFPFTVASPELDPETLTDMAENLAEGQWKKLQDAILIVNGGDGSVPFSQAASLIRRLSHSEHESPETAASASNGSTVGNPEPSPE